MASILIQFHADVEEIANLVLAAVRDFALDVALVVMNPFEVRVVSGAGNDLEMALREGGRQGIRVVMSKGGLNTAPKSSNSFLDANPGLIAFDIGGLYDGVLHESAFWTRTDDEGAALIAGKIARRLRAVTRAGAIAVNPDSGAEAVIRSHRYTEGAKRRFDEGVKIAPVAGKSTYKLPS